MIMEENLKIRILNHFVMKMALNTIFLHLEPLNKIEVIEAPQVVDPSRDGAVELVLRKIQMLE